jgi:hypothetical protein
VEELSHSGFVLGLLFQLLVMEVLMVFESIIVFLYQLDQHEPKHFSLNF